ncbi:MAG: acyltransferase family protein [Gammaproteobacteria bacterium]|nr:acyltransferase family protein [Gammaproteobacteria bacterium]
MPDSALNPGRQSADISQASELREAIRSHMPQLDALRGIAILWVILHNAALDGTGPPQSIAMNLIDLLSNIGWVGVQLFFVLSGFLITGILLDGRGATNQFRTFYARRTLRIFPLYYGFLLLAFVILPWLGIVTWHTVGSRELTLYWTYLINWGQPFIHQPVFPHLWSLAIEEQYYLLWPLLVIFLRKRTLAYVCAALIVTAFLSRAYIMFNYDRAFSEHAMYTFTITRWDALAVGSLLALLVRSDSALVYLQRYFTRGFVMLTMLLVAQIGAMRSFAPSGYQGILNQISIAVWFAMLVLLSIAPWHNQLDNLRPTFSNRFLRWVGKYSYAIYIFHFPAKLIWFSHFAIPVMPNAAWQQLGVTLYNFIGITALATAASYISWHVLEQPFLRLKRRFVLARSTDAAAA